MIGLANKSTVTSTDPFDDVNARIDHVIAESASRQNELRGLLISMFLLGVGVLIYGIWQRNAYLIGISVGIEGLLCWPIIRLEDLYRRTIALKVIPQITALLSPRDASKELCALIEHLLGKK